MFSTRVAIANQYACRTILEADRQFEISCNKCCNSPQCLHRSCEGCRVAEMHKYIVEELARNIRAEEGVSHE